MRMLGDDMMMRMMMRMMIIVTIELCMRLQLQTSSLTAQG